MVTEIKIGALQQHHRGRAASWIHHYVYVCIYACVRTTSKQACMHLCNWEMLMVHASTPLLQSHFSTRVVMYVSDLRLLNGILLTNIMPYRPNQSTHKLLPNHLFIHMQYDPSMSNTIFPSIIVTNTSQNFYVAICFQFVSNSLHECYYQIQPYQMCSDMILNFNALYKQEYNRIKCNLTGTQL